MCCSCYALTSSWGPATTKDNLWDNCTRYFDRPHAILIIQTTSQNTTHSNWGKITSLTATSLNPYTHPFNTHPFNGPFSVTTRVSRYQKDKTNLDFTEARDSESQWNPLGHMQVCTSLQTDNHASTPPFSFLQAGCPSCRPTNSVKALKAINHLRQSLKAIT